MTSVRPAPVDLIALGASLPVDHDRTLLTAREAEVLLIRLAPQRFREETHTGEETIVALTGSFGLAVNGEVTRVTTGSMITIPPDVTHRFTDDSEALILVVFSRHPSPVAP